MKTDPSSSAPEPPTEQRATQTVTTRSTAKAPRLTRAGAAWVATGGVLLLLVMLIIFILQNLARVEVSYLGLTGSIPLGVALLIAAVVGGLVVAIAGVTRVTQLRSNARQTRLHGRARGQQR